MRHVRRDVYHLWAHYTAGRLPSFARNSGDTQRFDGVHAYSYQAEIGRVVFNAKGEKAYILNSRSYSVTTSRHQTELARAIPDNTLIFHLSPRGCTYGAQDLDFTQEQAIQAYLEGVTELTARGKRARTNKLWLLSQARERLHELELYCGFFGIPVPADLDLENAGEKLQVMQAEARTRYEAERAERERKEAERLAEMEAETRAKVPNWLAGENVRLGYLPEAYLRIQPSSDGESVETSLGVTVPLGHVRKAMPCVLRALASGKTWTPDGCEIRLGNYLIRYIDATGVKVGCHWFTAEEARRFAQVLG